MKSRRLAFIAALLSASALAPQTAGAQDVSISFDVFHDRLAQHGDWVWSDRWGEVWIPEDVAEDFRPYDTDGYWAYTDEYGWLWVSDYDWGDIAFHYGRWVDDPDDGWMWIPGYVWSPAWVVWRGGGQYVGWMPMPPDEGFLSGGGFSISVDYSNVGGYYGYSRWYGPGYDQNRFAANWVFVSTGHLADRDFHHYEAPRERTFSIIQNTHNVTNYRIVNNYVVNRSVDVHMVENAGGHPVHAVHASEVIRHPEFVVHADQGRAVQLRMRAETPHGTGLAHSVGAPPAHVVESLSANPGAHAHAGAHIFTRQTIGNAPHGTMGGGAMTGGAMKANGASATGGAMTGTSGTMKATGSANGNAAGTYDHSTGAVTGRRMHEPLTRANGGPEGNGAAGNSTNGSASQNANPNSNGAPGNGRQTNGAGANGEETTHHPRREGEMGGASPNGGSEKGISSPMGGSSDMTSPTQGGTPQEKHHRDQGTMGGMSGENGTNAMTPSGGTATPETRHHHDQGTMGGMSNANGTNAMTPSGGTAMPEHHHGEGASGSMSRPAAGENPPHHQQTGGAPPKEKEKEKKKPENPGG